ncbi:twin transmembrane helix small protein [Pseudoroseicyclus aestuarii]|uniref:Hypoxia induced protein n=1 Tax=Pseudoroseicyclus aestuarii TaxID=1795041 RepID=A0A318ST05_9RHOB|nr:twin transmembrane helix small protein [Pseudoroseicyclus aestuarii]PYE85091.1 hypoxia induced protein [Pseudoroseicyclus aestuarii]
MAGDPLFILVVLSVAAVAVILLFGIGSFGRGGEYNRRNANKIMRLRIVAQAIAVGLILLLVALRQNG